MKKKSPADKLPRKAPKRTGRKGIGPALDPVKDFETPTRKKPEAAKEQAELLKVPATAPKLIVKDRMAIRYLRPIFDKTKKGKLTVALKFSLPITEEHMDVLPKIMHDGWQIISKRGRKRLDLIDVPPQRVAFYLASDIGEEALVMPAALVSHVAYAVVQKKGEGEAKKVIRLSFRLQVPVSQEVEHFAVHNVDADFWMVMKPSQEDLFDEDEEEE
jgi:hypothetical protein